MYSKIALIAAARVGQLCRYRTSSLSVEKKVSATALSQQLRGWLRWNEHRGSRGRRCTPQTCIGSPCVMDKRAAEVAPRQRHVQCGQQQLGAQVSGHRPADHAAREAVDDRGEIQPAFPGAHVGDVADQELVGWVGVKSRCTRWGS